MTADGFEREIAAIRSARSGRRLWAIAIAEPMYETTFSDEDVSAGVIEALLQRARAFTRPADIATAIAVACRLTAAHPGRQLLCAEEVVEKPQAAAALDRRIARLRKAAAARAAEVRVAALQALGCCKNSTLADARTVAAVATTERDAAVLASALLALCGMARRDSKLIARAEQAGTLHAHHRSLVVRVCAVACMAAAGIPVRRAAAKTLCTALTRPEPLPAAWGWWQEDYRENTAPLAVRILRNADVEPGERTRIAQALRKAKGDRKGRIYLVQESAMRLAFGEPMAPAKHAFTLEELDDAQRAAVATLDRDGQSWFAPLGLHSVDELAPFLAGKGGMWQPVEVHTREGPRRWHLVRIWREALAGDLDEREAVRAAVAGLDPLELARALCHPARGSLLTRSTDDERQRARDDALTLEVFRELGRSGFDLAAFVGRVSRGDGRPLDDSPLELAARAMGELGVKPDVARVIALLAAERLDDGIAELEAAAQRDVEILLDCMSTAERAARLADIGEDRLHALELMRLAYRGREIWASMPAPAAERKARALDVERLRRLVERWERASSSTVR